MAGTDGLRGQVILVPMVRGTIYSRCGWSGGTIDSMTDPSTISRTVRVTGTDQKKQA